LVEDASFPSSSNEAYGHWVGIAENCGDALTWLILTDEHKELKRSVVHSALKPDERNRRVHPNNGESMNPAHEFVKGSEQSSKMENDDTTMVFLDPSALLGCSYLTDPNDNGEAYRATIVCLIDEQHDQWEKEKTMFLVEYKGGPSNVPDEILTYNEVMEYIERELAREIGEQELGEQYWHLKRITEHQGPLKARDDAWKGSTWNVMVEWEDGSITYEPLTQLLRMIQ
jgi:hypothetical protein